MTINAPYDDRDGFIWMNGEMRPWRDAKLHVLSHGLHYGGSVFEGERVYDGHIFKLREHSERLLQSARLIDMGIPMSVEEIEQATLETIRANNIVDGYVRPVAWRGSEQMAVSAENVTVHVAIACWDWPKYFFPKNGENKGIALKTSKWHRPAPDTFPVQSKAAAAYVIGTMAKQEANDAGYDDALMLDYKGQIAESSGSNLFFVIDGQIKTPVADNFLNGLTRQTIIRLARECDYEVEETRMMPQDISKAQEVFVTGTAAEVTAVGKIDDIDYTPGTVTTRLQEAYADLVRQKQKTVQMA